MLNGKLRETNKGVERGRGIPTERGNPALPFLGAAAAVFSGYLEIFVAKKKWGEAICFVLARAAAVHQCVCVCHRYTHQLMCVCSKHPVADMKYEAENFS